VGSGSMRRRRPRRRRTPPKPLRTCIRQAGWTPLSVPHAPAMALSSRDLTRRKFCQCAHVRFVLPGMRGITAAESYGHSMECAPLYVEAPKRAPAPRARAIANERR
jgi:hypothetical protein